MPDQPTPARQHVHLGWQLTGACNRSCPYCLRLRTDKPSAELDEEACARILESYLDFLRLNAFIGSIMYSGGNPMLRRDLPRLLERTGWAKGEGLIDQVTILANPETIDQATAAHLAACRVDVVFISLDGRGENNDRMRGRGSHDAALRAIPRLIAAGVRVNIKFTLSRYNLRDAPYVFEVARSLGVGSVGIGIMSEPSAAEAIADMLVSAEDYREHLLSLVQYDDLADDGQRRFARASVRLRRGLHALLYHELGRLDEFRRRLDEEDGDAFPGVGPRPAGRMFVVWEDGSVHASNPEAYPILGMVPQESFQAIHLRRIAEGRDRPFRHGRRDPASAHPAAPACAACPVRAHCAGDDPHCWRLVREAASRQAS